MRIRTPATVTIFVLLIGAAGGIIAVLANPRRPSEEILSKFSDAGVTVAVITVATAFITGSFRFLDARRVRDQERRRVFHEVVDAHNEVKAVRRSFAALGLWNPRQHLLGGDREQDALTAEEAKDLRATMSRLNDAQLRFEAIKREVEQSDFFRRKEDVYDILRDIEHFLNREVLDRWEDHASSLWAAEAPPESVEILGLRVSMAGNFTNRVSKPLESLTIIMQQELYGGRPGKLWNLFVRKRGASIDALLDEVTMKLAAAIRRQRHNANPGPEDLYVWGAALTELTNQLREVTQVLMGQGATEGGRPTLPDDDGNDPTDRLTAGTRALNTVLAKLDEAHAAAGQFHAVGQIGVEVDRKR